MAQSNTKSPTRHILPNYACVIRFYPDANANALTQNIYPLSPLNHFTTAKHKFTQYFFAQCDIRNNFEKFYPSLVAAFFVRGPPILYRPHILRACDTPVQHQCFARKEKNPFPLTYSRIPYTWPNTHIKCTLESKKVMVRSFAI